MGCPSEGRAIPCKAGWVEIVCPSAVFEARVRVPSSVSSMSGVAWSRFWSVGRRANFDLRDSYSHSSRFLGVSGGWLRSPWVSGTPVRVYVPSVVRFFHSS